MPATNLPPVLQSLSLFLCERVIQEKDDVLTYFRNIEVFNLAISPDFPIDKQGAILVVVVIGKLQLNDVGEHSIRLQLTRPGGETKLVGTEHKGVFTANLSNYPGGFTIVEPVGVAPKEMGLHYMAVLFDGEEVARTPFMLQPASPISAG